MPTIAQVLAEFVLETDEVRVPGAALERMAVHVLDLLAVGLAGAAAPSSGPVVGVVAELAPGRDATVFGKGRIASAAGAALANGALAHALELDDDHRTGTVHPGAVVVPAALAAGEAAGASGRRLLRAVLLGYEVMCRAGEAFGGRQFYRGFHPTGTCGVFGAAVAAGVVLGLDRDALVRALGIAGTQASGLGEWRTDGSWIKRLHPGRAAASGLLAAWLARDGFTGPATIFEGASGFLQAFAFEGEWDAGALTRGLGREFRALATAFKPYACCRFAHGAIDLALDLAREGVGPEQIDAVQVRLYRTDILTYQARPASPVAAQFSVPYLVAVALARGRVGVAELSGPTLGDPAVLALADRVRVEEDPAFTARYPARYPTEVRVRTRDGREIVRFRDCPRGDPEAPDYAGQPGRLHREVEDKVRALLHEAGHGPRAEALIGAARALPDLPGVRALADLVGEGGPA